MSARIAHRLTLGLWLVAGALAPSPALAQEDPTSREGVHSGVGIGPIFSRYLDLSKDVYGVDTRFFLNIGLTRSLDFRFGLTGDASGSQTSYMSVAAPAEIRFNLGKVHSMALGFAAGLVTDTKAVGFFIGPEWALLALRFGQHREFELSVPQGVHFQLGRAGSQTDLIHLQTSLVLSYLFLSPSP